jgi:HNH endonuclease
MSVLAELLSRTKPDGECLIWQGGTNGKGYGVIHRRPVNYYVHRLVCEAVHGLKPGQIAMHTCDRPSCINPDHLRAGSYSDNSRDAVIKGRAKYIRPDLAKLAREGRFKNARLRPADILQIRTMLAAGVKQGEIGAKFGVGSRAISKINVGQRWGHVGAVASA